VGDLLKISERIWNLPGCIGSRGGGFRSQGGLSAQAFLHRAAEAARPPASSPPGRTCQRLWIGITSSVAGTPTGGFAEKLRELGLCDYHHPDGDAEAIHGRTGAPRVGSRRAVAEMLPLWHSFELVAWLSSTTARYPRTPSPPTAQPSPCSPHWRRIVSRLPTSSFLAACHSVDVLAQRFRLRVDVCLVEVLGRPDPAASNGRRSSVNVGLVTRDRPSAQAMSLPTITS